MKKMFLSWKIMKEFGFVKYYNIFVSVSRIMNNSCPQCHSRFINYIDILIAELC